MTGSWPTDLPRSLDYPDFGADAILAGGADSRRRHGVHRRAGNGRVARGGAAVRLSAPPSVTAKV